MSNVIDEKQYLGTAAVEKLISNTKEALSTKQPIGDYVTETRATELINNAVDGLGAVSYNAQTLTEEQKAQVRENLGVTAGIVSVKIEEV